MPTTINLPELGEGVDSVDVVTVLVAVGERVEKDQGLIEVETEKASVEVPSTAAGTVTEIHVSPGDVLGENAPIVTLEVAEGQTESPPEPAPEPEIAERQRSGGAEERRSRKEEEKRGKGAEEHETETMKTDAVSAPAERVSIPPPPAAPRDNMKAIPAAPTVRRFAREIGADLRSVEGSGPGGRISIDDVKAHANRLLAGSRSGTTTAPLALPDLEIFGAVHREPMSKVRKLTAENLTRAWHTVPQVTNHETADITDVEEFRKAYRERVEAVGGKLTVTAVLVKIVASALKMHPVLNAAVDMVRQEIVFRRSINIGVAVDTERGLLVPVVRDADAKNLTTIAVELDDLASRARSRKLKPDDMQGGSFTISNLGGIGGTGFTPIVNWPEVAILGVSRGRIEPQWHEGSFRPRLMMPLSLSYDHRVVDGADAARFLARLKDALEQPLLLVFEG
jgi:pyruvate dehydrogenase E2 component (dihydrolipoamide acetyltransferase)